MLDITILSFRSHYFAVEMGGGWNGASCGLERTKPLRFILNNKQCFDVSGYDCLGNKVVRTS